VKQADAVAARRGARPGSRRRPATEALRRRNWRSSKAGTTSRARHARRVPARAEADDRAVEVLVTAARRPSGLEAVGTDEGRAPRLQPKSDGLRTARSRVCRLATRAARPRCVAGDARFCHCTIAFLQRRAQLPVPGSPPRPSPKTRRRRLTRSRMLRGEQARPGGCRQTRLNEVARAERSDGPRPSRSTPGLPPTDLGRSMRWAE